MALGAAEWSLVGLLAASLLGAVGVFWVLEAATAMFIATFFLVVAGIVGLVWVNYYHHPPGEAARAKARGRH